MLVFRLIILFLLAFLISPKASYSNETLLQIKSFQLFRIANYLAVDNEVKKVCIVGDKTLKSGFLMFASRSPRIANIDTQEFPNYSPELSSCSLIFLSKSIGYNGINNILKNLKSKLNIMITVSDYPDFIPIFAGTVEIFKFDNEYRFAINSYKKVKKDIIVSSKLLEAADRLY